MMEYLVIVGLIVIIGVVAWKLYDKDTVATAKAAELAETRKAFRAIDPDLDKHLLEAQSFADQQAGIVSEANQTISDAMARRKTAQELENEKRLQIHLVN